jgi:hypothetical protein
VTIERYHTVIHIRINHKRERKRERERANEKEEREKKECPQPPLLPLSTIQCYDRV